MFLSLKLTCTGSIEMDQLHSHRVVSLGYLNAIAKALNDGPEVGPLLWNGMPALAHEAIDRAWTIVRGFESTPVGDELHDLLVTPAWVRHVP